MKFKTDENLPGEVADQLRNAGHDAMTIMDQRMQGDPDSQVATACRNEGRALITLDLDFADIRAYPPADQPEFIVLRPTNQAKPTVMALVDQLLPFLESEPLNGCLWIMQNNRLRIRESDPWH